VHAIHLDRHMHAFTSTLKLLHYAANVEGLTEDCEGLTEDCISTDTHDPGLSVYALTFPLC